MRILIVHGPNLDRLGRREPDVYGRTTLEEINALLVQTAAEQGVELETFQSNHEGEIVSRIGRAAENFHAIVLNPAAYTHTSVAIRDAVAACGLPVVEVHLSNVYRREEFRHHSLIAPVAVGQVSGFGAKSYQLGLLAAIDALARKEAP